MKQSKNAGLTLIELMIAVAIVSVLMVAIYTVYEAQVRGQISQEVALELQQGLRGALSIMEREIRTAGADPTGNANSAILIADVSEFHFTRDIAGTTVDNLVQYDGDLIEDRNEDIRYAINAAGHLGRETCNRKADGTIDCGNLQSILDNVDALNFVYIDREGNVLATPVAANRRDDIRRVEVTIVARSGQSDRGMLRSQTDRTVYVNQRGDVILPAPNDTSRRLRMTTTITCRNMATGI